MTENCDRCAPPKLAVYLVSKDAAMLALCAACGQQYWPMLRAQGWYVAPLTSDVPQLTEAPLGKYWIDAEIDAERR